MFVQRLHMNLLKRFLIFEKTIITFFLLPNNVLQKFQKFGYMYLKVIVFKK